MPYKSKEKMKEYQKTWHQNNKSKDPYRNQKRRNRRKEWFKHFLSNQKCTACEEGDYSCLDLHHLDPSTKRATVSNLVSGLRSFESVIEEISKCVVVCSNCHRKEHAGRLKIRLESTHLVDISNLTKPENF